jgi:hypothetical protein
MQKFKYVKAAKDNKKEKDRNRRGKKKEKESQGSLKIQTKNCGPRRNL